MLDPGQTRICSIKQVLSEKEYQEADEKYGYDAFRVGMGAEAIQELLKAIDLEKDSEDLQKPGLTGCHRTEACPYHQASGSRRGIP